MGGGRKAAGLFRTGVRTVGVAAYVQPQEGDLPLHDHPRRIAIQSAGTAGLAGILREQNS